MKDTAKTKAQLVEELKTLRARVATLEQAETEHKQAEAALRESAQQAKIAYEQATIYAQELKAEIVERRRMEEALQRSQAEWEKTFNAMSDWVSLIDLDGRILRSNQAGEKYVAVSLAEMMGQTCCRVIHDSEEFIPDCPLLKMIDSRQQETVELQVTNSNRWLMITVEPVLDEAGNVTSVVHIVRDTTERKRAEEEHQKAERQLRTIVEALPDFLVRFDEQCRHLYVNPTTEKILGLPLEHFIGKTFFDLNAPGPAGQNRTLYAAIKQAFEQGYPNMVEAVWPTTKGDRIFEIRHIPELGERGKVVSVIGIARDITERKQAEERLQTYAQQLRALGARLSEVEGEERRRMARELHDQVGQNLTALGINLNIVHSLMPEQAPQSVQARLADSLSLVDETTERVRDVMADLRPPVLDDYGLLAALKWYGEHFASRTNLAVLVEGELPDPRPATSVENALFRVAQEALTNVAKHAQATQITMTVEASVKTIRMVIADDGVGLDHTEHDAPHGWGLLTMQERVEAVGGTFRIEARSGQGTRVVLEAPRITGGEE
jgi:PAS domain S-box-containing protein